MKTRAALLTMALTGLVVSRGVAESVSIVQITDMRGQSEFKVMNREEIAAVSKEIKDETAIFTAIVTECKKEWDANKENKVAFQGNRVKPRSAKKLGADFTDREKAEKKCEQFADRASEKQSEEMDKQSKKAKQSKDADVAKEEARVKAFDDAFSMISKKMGDKLGRPVQSIGFEMGDAKKDEAKGEKKEAKKDEKKGDAKKGDAKKDEKKKEEKKAL